MGEGSRSTEGLTGPAVGPVISVIIPHYGTAEPTLALVSALVAQEGNPEGEIIVADDSSPVPFPDGHGYSVVRRVRNAGFGSAVNSGAGVARGSHLLILNSDAVVESSFLADMRAATALRPQAVLGPKVMDGGAPQVTAWRWPRVRGLVAEWLEPLASVHGDPRLEQFWGADLRAQEASDAVAVDWLVGACLLIPRGDFQAVGGFDESFFMNCEEIDIQRRLRDRGLESIYLPHVAVSHSAGGSSDPAKKSGWLVDARFRYHQKWGGAHALLVGLSVASVVNLLWNLSRRLRGRPVAPWVKFRHQLTLILHGWRHRRNASPRG